MSDGKQGGDPLPDFLFRQPRRRAQDRRRMAFIIFTGLVAWLALLVILRQFTTLEFTILIGAILLCMAGIMYELVSRRFWETMLLRRFRHINEDYARLVREVARNRNEIADLKKGLAGVGTTAKSWQGLPAEEIEERMLRDIVGQLNQLGATPRSSMGEDAKPLTPAPSPGKKDGKKRYEDIELDEAGLNSLDEVQIHDIIVQAVELDRIDVFMQPIVNLPQRKLRFAELYSRIGVKPGLYLPASRYIDVAERGNMVTAIDNLLLLRGLQLVRDTAEQNPDSDLSFFCNIATETLNDPKFMGDLVEFLAQNRTLAPRLVFELGQSDLEEMAADIAPVLDGIAQLGCRFSMDEIVDMKFNYAKLEARHIRFLKVDSDILLQEMEERGGLRRLKRLKSDLDRLGVDLIVSKIETEKQLVTLLDMNIDYGQGYLFGKPEICTELDL